MIEDNGFSWLKYGYLDVVIRDFLEEEEEEE